MPTSILQRLRPDSIQEFRAAAMLRYSEATELARLGNGTAAIYLWGYSAEMTVKAAYFHLLGHPPAGPIQAQDLSLAVHNTALGLGIVWPKSGKFHNVECWAQLLVAYRRAYGKPYRSSGFGQEVEKQAEAVYDRWRETLRYHKNRAYSHEVAKVGLATKWLLDHSNEL